MFGGFTTAWRLIRAFTGFAASTAVVGGTALSINTIVKKIQADNPIVSLGGSPPPDGSFSVWEMGTHLCEFEGLSCTCSNVKDWVATYAAWVDTGLRPGIRDLDGKITPNETGATKAVLDAEAEIRRFEEAYAKNGGWEYYDCSDISDGDTFLAGAGRERIKAIVEDIKRVRRAGTNLAGWVEKYGGNEVQSFDVIDRHLDPEATPPDADGGGPDSKSIGLGLLAGGAIALALIMGQSKTRGRF